VRGDDDPGVLERSRRNSEEARPKRVDACRPVRLPPLGAGQRMAAHGGWIKLVASCCSSWLFQVGGSTMATTVYLIPRPPSTTSAGLRSRPSH
jgi:hypothetical protein